MKTFKQLQIEIEEGRLASISTFSTVGLILKIKALDTKIQNSTNPTEQNKLLSLQAKYLSYVAGMSVAVSASDSKLLTRLNKGLTRKERTS
jgi:hypothetical protein